MRTAIKAGDNANGTAANFLLAIVHYANISCGSRCQALRTAVHNINAAIAATISIPVPNSLLAVVHSTNNANTVAGDNILHTGTHYFNNTGAVSVNSLGAAIHCFNIANAATGNSLLASIHSTNIAVSIFTNILGTPIHILNSANTFPYTLVATVHSFNTAYPTGINRLITSSNNSNTTDTTNNPLRSTICVKSLYIPGTTGINRLRSIITKINNAADTAVTD